MLLSFNGFLKVNKLRSDECVLVFYPAPELYFLTEYVDRNETYFFTIQLQDGTSLAFPSKADVFYSLNGNSLRLSFAFVFPAYSLSIGALKDVEGVKGKVEASLSIEREEI